MTLSKNDIKGNTQQLIQMCIEDKQKHLKRIDESGYYSQDKIIEGRQYDKEIAQANDIYINELITQIT